MRPLSLQKFMAQNAGKSAGKKIEIPKAPEDGKDYFHGTSIPVLCLERGPGCTEMLTRSRSVIVECSYLCELSKSDGLAP